jgi:hydrogenase maturation protease
VVGLGNELLSDEGLGVHVARALKARRSELAGTVAVLDAGTALLEVLGEIAGAERVVLVDAVRAGGAPGTVYRGADVGAALAAPASAGAMSLHEFGVGETLQAAARAGLLPARVDLVGAEPERFDPGLELSPALAAAAERIVEMLVAELGAERESAGAKRG